LDERDDTRLRSAFSKFWKRIRRPQYRALTPDSHNLSGYTREAERLLGDSNEVESFTLEPNAWLEALSLTPRSRSRST
jgi:hypothetical protein